MNAIVSCGFPSNKKFSSRHQLWGYSDWNLDFLNTAALRLVGRLGSTGSSSQCFIRENCGGGAVALWSGGGTTSSCSHWWSFFPEAKGSEELQNSAGLFIRWCSPIIYYSTTTPAELGSVRVMRKFAKTTFWHLLDSFHSAAVLLQPPCFWIGFVMAELCLLLYILILLGQGNWMHLMRQLCKDKKINHHSFHVLSCWNYSDGFGHQKLGFWVLKVPWSNQRQVEQGFSSFLANLMIFQSSRVECTAGTLKNHLLI